ncbi:MAG: VWA domain-containing protein [Anaerolineae bacterium]|nr:VWA domain-containing protein [Anaerolineae bacterium]
MLKQAHHRFTAFSICLAFVMLAVALVASQAGTVARADEAQPAEGCAGGPEFDGVPLDQCHVETFEVGGEAKSITVWYTLDQTPKKVDLDDGPGTNYLTRTHGLDSDNQAQHGAAKGREAWETYFRVFNKSPRDTGPNCGGNIDVWVYDTRPGPSHAKWPDRSDDCIIVVSTSELRGDPRYAFYHEFFHYLQFAYDDGCYDFQYATAVRGIWDGSDEFSEGYADLGTDIIDQSKDDTWFDDMIHHHRNWRSIYHESYWNLFTKYYAEQVGSQWTTADPEYHMDAVREHYEECDAQDTMYVLEELVPSLTGGTLTMEELVMNFFAANYTNRWVSPDPDLQLAYPELYYVDHDPPDYGFVRYIESVNLTGSESWHGDFVLTAQEDAVYNSNAGDTMTVTLSPMPQPWAAYYYRVYPQAGCDYVTASVKGEPGARLGMSLIAYNANPNMADYFKRYSWIGESFSRTFHRQSNNFPVAAIVNSFDSMHEYDVSFDCVVPTVNIREPRQVDFALVGLPASPSTFLLRFEVSSGGSPVRGLTESDIEVWVGGQAASLVAGTFQEVGEEYWAIVQPPAVGAGTTWAEVQVILNGTIGDSESQAVLYVEPGHNDMVLLFDASSSMDIEGVLGEGKRYENAQKAGTIVADLLRDGDRVAVMDFSAIGISDPTYDIRTLLSLTPVTVPDTIDDAKAAIDNISPRNLTPIGQALVEAKDELATATGSMNPQTIILLSDGEENVPPLYDTVAAELDASGVVIDTIGLSDEADEDLMARIAAENSGTYRHVPTSSGTVRGLDESQRAQLLASGVPEETVSALATTVLPGPLGLDEVYDYLETKNQGASRLFVQHYTGVALDQWVTRSLYVDPSAGQLRLVVGSKQPHGTPGNYRFVEVKPPGSSDWIVISGLGGPDPLPLGWNVRISTYDHVIVIDNPDPGTWGIRTKGYNLNMAQAPQQTATFDFMLSGSVQSDIRLEGRFLAPVVDNQGLMGDHVPIVATLLADAGGVAGANVVAVVDRPSGTFYLNLHDDGEHGDASAADGIYGNVLRQTDQGGTYNVRIVGAWQEGGTGDWLTREWSGAFWLRSIEDAADDADGDNMPDWWEAAHGLDVTVDDAHLDLDMDGLLNIHELQVGAHPNQADSDHGGENDHSEAGHGRDPGDPSDDTVEKLGVVTTVVYNGTVVVFWPYADAFGNMQLWVSTDPDDKGSAMDIGTTGVYTLTGLANDQTYHLRLVPVGLDGLALGAITPPMPVMPKADPDAPNGSILINGGARSTASKAVILEIAATDVPLDGPSSSASGAVANRWTETLNEVSGDVEMRLSNDESFAGVTWEPYTFHKPWTLGEPRFGVYRVYAQFRDGAGNLSTVVYDDIQDAGKLYLPLVVRMP